MHEKLTGLIAAPPTPMEDDGEIALNTIEAQFENLRASGVRGAFVCGTTGESMSLSVEERLEVAERWVAVAPQDFTVIVHVGHTSLPECRSMAAHAMRIGADAVGAMAPCFFKPAGTDELVDFCAEVAAAAPDLPFYYYHIPSVTGVAMPMAEFLQRAAQRIPNLAGMKFTHESLMDYLRCLRLQGGRFDILFGRDEMLLAALAVGARGAVGGTYNLAAPLYLRIVDAYESGDTESARTDQATAAEFVAILQRFGGLRACKAAMGFIGVDCGPPRLPLRCLTPQRTDELHSALEQIGFFDWCNRS